jgi:pyruvate formate lyase activating enzyme
VIQGALEQGVVDYLAMDIKAPLARYAELVGVAVSEDAILESIKRIKESGVDYEFRSVLIKGFHSNEDIAHMRGLVAGSKRYRLLTFRPQNTLCPAFALHEPFSDDEMRAFQEAAGAVVGEVLFEGANG